LNLVIDEGNTLIKVAVYDGSKQQFFEAFEKDNFQQQFLARVPLQGYTHAIIATVVAEAEERFSFLSSLVSHCVMMSAQTPVPFTNRYATPHSLGIDRIALVAGAVSRFPQHNTLIIDAGTCLTFDFVNKKNEYLGGAIAPGIAMRLKAMHHFTSKLPLISEQDFDNQQFIGTNTRDCMLSGVYNNIVCEIDGVIAQYTQKYPDLTTILTGGNQIYLEKRIKNRIFAGSFVLLEGLNAILEYQKQL
jgi:pantothenate kinase, type III